MIAEVGLRADLALRRRPELRTVVKLRAFLGVNSGTFRVDHNEAIELMKMKLTRSQLSLGVDGLIRPHCWTSSRTSRQASDIRN